MRYGAVKDGQNASRAKALHRARPGGTDKLDACDRTLGEGIGWRNVLWVMELGHGISDFWVDFVWACDSLNILLGMELG